MKPNRELITLQFGPAANAVGAHYWNLQECWARRACETGDLDVTNVLYSTSDARQGEPVYSPRLVLCDASGSLGSGWAALPAPPTQAPETLDTWQQPPELVVREACNDATVPSFAPESVWTPHAQTTQLIPGVWKGVTPFGHFADGCAKAIPSGFGEGVADTVASFLEQCDHPQGFQCFVDDQSGFGGLATDIIQAVREDCGLPCVIYCTRAPALKRDVPSQQRNLNAALSYANLAPVSDLYCIADGGLAPAVRRVDPTTSPPSNWTGELALALAAASQPYALAGLGTEPPNTVVAGDGLRDLRDTARFVASVWSSPLAGLASCVAPGMNANSLLDRAVPLAPRAPGPADYAAVLDSWLCGSPPALDTRLATMKAVVERQAASSPRPPRWSGVVINQAPEDAEGAPLPCLARCFASAAFEAEVEWAQREIRRTRTGALAGDDLQSDVNGLQTDLEELRLAYSAADV